MADDLWLNLPRMQGYLERKFKLRVCSWWRKYWFVLDGKTLLCFKSQEESENYYKHQDRSARKAFLSFANVHAVRRICSSHPDRHSFQIITRGPTIHLAAASNETRELWLDALQNALQLPLITPPVKQRGESLLRRALSMSVTASLIRQHSSNSQPNLTTSSWQRKNTLSINSSQSLDPSDEEEAHKRGTKLIKPDIVIDLQEEKKNDVTLRKNFGGNCGGNSLAPPPRQSIWRNTTTDFFLGEQNRDWPGLSLDLYDEVLDELMFNVRDSGLRTKTAVAATPGLTVDVMGQITDKDTQTDFSDEDQDHDKAYWNNHISDVQNDLISYLSITSLNKSLIGERRSSDSSLPSSETDSLVDVPTLN